DPSATGTLTSPASRPFVSVVIVCAETGCTDNANPVASDVVTNPRRDHCDRGSTPSNSASTMSIASSLGSVSLGPGNFQPRLSFGKGRSPKSDRSVIVVVVEAETGAARLAGLA